MPERCNKCGIAALESQSFIEENFPFMRRRFYCPACHQRLVHRICIGFTVVIVAIAAVATFEAVRMQEPILNYPGFSILFLVVVQWLLTVPHELGHAIAARLLGYDHIRILIGAGKTLVSFELAGFYWVINAIPFGGLTIANAPAKPRRWKEFILVSAGLAVNAALALAAWFYIGPGGLFYPSGNAAKLFFWANVVVLVENLIPRAAETPYGNTFSDGWQIWHVLFRWKKPNPKSNVVPIWEVFMRQMVKWSVAVILFVGALFLVWIASIPFLTSFGSMRPMNAEAKVAWAAIFGGFALVCGWCCWRVFQEPIARIQQLAETEAGTTASLIAGYRAVFNEEQLEMWAHMGKLFNSGHFAEAAMLLDRLIPIIADYNSEGYVHLLLVKVICLLNQNQIDEAESLCLNYIQQSVSKEQKLKMLDGIASHILYHSVSASLPRAEKFARMGLEIAPGTLTLKGTLGALLAEQGNYSEAEPLLVECLELSPALHDHAIATFYLGMIKLRTGLTKEGKRLIKRGMKMYPEAWIVAKGNVLLKDTVERRVP